MNKKTVQQSLTGEEVASVSRVETLSLKDIIWLPIRYLLSTIDLQKLLFLSSFLTYGVGDGVTAGYMMEKTGFTREVNPVARFMYTNSGKQGVIGLKIWFAVVILFSIWLISRKTNMYWTINGFLFALTIGGAVAVTANMMAAFGMKHPSPGYIILTFLFLVILLVSIGDLLDKLHTSGR